MINQMIKEVEAALENGLFLVALNTALTFPDICGKVAYPDLDGKKKRYIKWFEEYIGQYEHFPADKNDSKMPYMSGEIVYALRCSLSHEGNPSIRLSDHNLASFKLLKTDNMNYAGSAGYMGEGEHRTIEIAIWNLCFKLCSLAKYYYEENKDKFKFNYTIEEFPPKWMRRK